METSPNLTGMTGQPSTRENGLHDLASMTDSQLLERFACQHEAPAFEALVRRHGPMVLRVCERVLHDPHDAEDAFQATFIVLVRKASSIAKRESVGSWLYGTAYRIALKARAAASKRNARQTPIEAPPAARPGLEPATAAAWHDLRPVLDEELNRLPEKYRAPVVLCYLEGKTNDEAAEQLGRSRGKIAGQLSRARDLLRNRLIRRGVALSTGTLAALLGQQAASAAVPTSLAAATLQAVTLTTAGKAAAAGLVATPAIALADSTLKAMAVFKVKVMASAVVALSVLAAGTALVLYQKPPESIVNSIGMKLAYIPPGQFLMGSSEADIARWTREQPPGWASAGYAKIEGPQHKVTITRAFYLGVSAVTQGQYQTVMGKNPSANQVSADHPVEHITWDEAAEFCKKLSERPEEKKAGRVYRLPTEAEREYACRAGTASAFHFGDSLLPSQANVNMPDLGKADSGPRMRTAKVGSYPPSPWGLYDMHGNVREWCLDGLRTYSAESVTDPRGPETPGAPRALRGGDWVNPAWYARSAFRMQRDPSQRTNHTGFRLVWER